MVTIKSRPIPLNSYTDVFDEEAVGKTIAYRKSKWDEGVDKVQNTLNQLNSLPTITDEDSEYLNNKVSQLTSSINKTAGLDLSNSMNVGMLMNAGNDITNDEVIQNAVSSARNYQKNISYINEAKTNPKKYGDVVRVQNEDDYYEQLQDYKNKRANGQNAVFQYTYQPYKDVEGLLSKEMEKLKASATSEMNGNYFIDKELMSPARIEEIARQRIASDPSLSNQLRINAKYSTKNIPDAVLLETKNKAQLAQINARRDEASKELLKLNSLDASDPNKNKEIIKKAKEALSNYDRTYQMLLQNPNKVLLDDNTLGSTYNREQLAYELTHQSLVKDLVAKHSYTKTKLRANPIPLKEQSLDFQRTQANIENDLEARKFLQTQEQAKIENMFKQFSSTNGKKMKIDPSGNLISVDVPSSTSYDDNPKETLNAELESAKLAGKNFLKDLVKKKINDLGTMISPDFLDKYADLMIRDDGTMVNLDENKSVNRLKQQFIQVGNKTIPEDVAVRNTIRWINRLSRDANNVWTGEGTLSKENAKSLSDYQNHIQKVHTLSNIDKIALDESLRKAGVSKSEYDNLLLMEKRSSSNSVQSDRIVGNYSSGITGDNKAKLNKVREFEKKYYADKTQVTNLYAKENFDSKSDMFYGLENDMTSYIRNKGLSESSLSLDGKVFGKEQVWDKREGQFKRLIPKSYNPKTQRLEADVIMTDKEGNDITYPFEKFYVPNQYVDKYISEEVKKGSRDLTYTDQLHLTPNGKITLRGKDGKYKPSWRTTPTVLPLQWQATLQNPENRTDNTVDVWVNLPGQNAFKLPNPASNAELAEQQLTSHIENVVSQLMPLVKSKQITEAQMKERVLQSLMPK